MSINYWELTKDFSVGDIVQQFLPGQGITPYVGRVLAVLPGIGFVDVQWPFGSERVSPEMLLRSSPEFVAYLPPTMDFSYFPGMDALKKARAGVPKNLWRTTQVPPGFHKDLARLFHSSVGAVLAYDTLWRNYGASTEDGVLRDEVRKFYHFASKSFDLFLQHARKTATYWAAQNRQHRATRAEVSAQAPNCPRCGTPMRRTTYKMAEGQKVRLFACPQDLYLIRQADILGPDGSPVEW